MDIGNKFTRTQEINGKSYTIQTLPALKAVGLAKTLSKILLPALGGAVDGLRVNEFGETPKTFTDLAIMVCTQLDDLDLDAMILLLLRNLSCDGTDVKDVNIHFQGDIGELVAVLEFALRENFSSFFTGSGLSARLTGMISKLGVET